MNRVMPLSRSALLVALVAVLVAVLGTVAVRSLTCEYEDSTGCVWVGPLQGNGKGSIVVNF